MSAPTPSNIVRRLKPQPLTKSRPNDDGEAPMTTGAPPAVRWCRSASTSPTARTLPPLEEGQNPSYVRPGPFGWGLLAIIAKRRTEKAMTTRADMSAVDHAIVELAKAQMR